MIEYETKSMKCFILAFIFTMGFIFVTGCKPDRETSARSRPALSTDDESPLQHEDEPLLLDDEPLLLDDDTVESPGGPMADNSRCHVCHMNYIDEDVAVVHARVNIGCADCHGPSDAHIADESWASGGNGTAPDIMYLPEAINPFCMGCHPGDKLNAIPHEDVLAGKLADTKYCTDCHGNHRLVRRRCKWK
jgi:hypothetical protein